MKLVSLAATIALAVATLIAAAGDGRAADIKIFCSNGFQAVMAVLGPQYEKASGHRLVVSRFIATADLGIDQVQILRLTGGGLARVSRAATAAGAGPRHIAFHPSGRLLYVLNESNATVTVFDYDSPNGRIGSELQTVPTEPAGYRGRQSTAEIAVHPSGKFLYVSNRGHDSIAGYRIDPATGLLSVIGHATDGVAFPRHFAIDPSGTRLYVANGSTHPPAN